ncbi:DNA-binding protein [Microbacterium sp. CFBP 13617]|uniref:DNA-binding protein n=1 Tax=Microbacterium sp. CFBP 13617 TaxID=2774035 RepID=UPI0017848E4B|nr:DNA-binding protein [Microbacterium sp. CFBP 13617]MBD8218184.1 DNA-binding protein [Microbacterium sp. CFBP 13617]
MSRLRRRHTSRILDVPVATLRAWADAGVGPQPDRRGRYDPDEVDAWAGEMSAALPTMDPC